MSRLYIGLMSGTSMDGVDAVLMDVNRHQCIATLTLPYDRTCREWLDDVLHAQSTSPARLKQLDTLVGREFGKATRALLEKAACRAQDVVAVGSHGQTLCHDACAEIPYTLQLGCPHTIAEMTGIAVVAD